MPQRYILFFFLIVGVFKIDAQRQPEFQAFNIDDGLINNDVRCVYQDSKGFIWAGTVRGLSRFNAYEFDVFEADPSNPQALSDNDIRAIYEDRDGFIWIGTVNGGLNRFDPKTEQFKSWQANPYQTDQLSDNSIYSITQDKDGLLWLATKEGGLNCFNPQTEKFTSWQQRGDNPTSLPSNSLWTLYYDTNSGVLWIGTSNGLCTMSKKGVFRNVEGATDIIASIHAVGNDIWVGTWGAGLFNVNKSTQTLTQRWDTTQGLPDKSVTGIFPSQYGGLWLSTYESGLVHFYPAKNNFKVFRTGLNRADYNWQMIEDHTGNLWAATLGGLVQHQVAMSTGFGTFTIENTPRLSSNLITLITGSSTKEVWVGTLGRAIRYDFSQPDQPEVTAQIDFPSLSGDYMVKGISQAPDSSFWVSTWRKGIHRFRLDAQGNVVEQQQLSGSDSFPRVNDSQIISTFEDRKNRLWISSLTGLSYIDLNTLESKNYFADRNNPNALSDNYTYQVYESQDGNIWVATAKGLNRFNEASGSFKAYLNEANNKNSLSHNEVQVLFEDSKHTLWVGTDGGGLNWFNKETETFQAITEEDGLAGNSITGIAEGPQGYLWISTNKGLSRFSVATKTCKNYDSSDGLLNNDFETNTTITFPSGYIFAGSTKGFHLFHPDQLKENEFVPPVVLSSLKLAGKEVPIYHDSLFANSPLKQSIGYVERLELSHKDKVIEFEFAALNFIKPQQSQYKYMMKGFETEWREATAASRIATYTNLPRGKELVFTVLASNDDGKWNTVGTSITIYVRPPFWETWWFQLGIILAFMAGTAYFFRGKIKRLEIHKKILKSHIRNLQFRRDAAITQNDLLRQQQVEVIAEKNLLEASIEDLKMEQEFVRVGHNETQQLYEEVTAQKEHIERINEELKTEKEYTRTAGTELHQQQEEILALRELAETKKEVVRAKSQEVINTLRYAKAMQQITLPPSAVLQALTSAYFTIFRPKSLVSGDFYWATNIEDQHFIAVADCTGHGAHGAFMSLIGKDLLDSIIIGQRIFDPAEVLAQMHNAMREIIEQDPQLSSDGMDLAICKIEHSQEEVVHVTFSGAKRPLFYTDRGTLKQVKGDKKSIGRWRYAEELSFTNIELQLHKGEMIYLTSDGFVAQNDPSGKKYGTKKLRQVLTNIMALDVQMQHECLINELDSHQADQVQRDDITVMGIKL